MVYPLPFFCLLVAFYCLYSRPLQQYEVSLPSMFAAGGAVLAYIMASNAPDQVPRLSEENFKITRVMAEATLVIVLFSDASLIRFSDLKVSWRLPFRLLGIGMPLTILLGILFGWLFVPDQSWWSLLLLSAILAPTDASLVKPVVTKEIVPEAVRETVNVESGLNDGIAVPIVVVAASMVPEMASGRTLTDGPPFDLVQFILLQLLLAPAIGAAIGYCFAEAFNRAVDQDGDNNPETDDGGWFEDNFQGIFFLVTAFLCYLIADMFNSSGFIAAFVGGIIFGNAVKSENRFIEQFMDTEGQLFTMATFFMFGLVLIPLGLQNLDWKIFLLAVAFLTVIRMVPVWISLTGAKRAGSVDGTMQPFSAQEKLFVGWFGPRGLASILFALLFLESHELQGYQTLITCVVITVTFSVLLHGMSAGPLSRKLYGNSKTPNK